MKNNILKIAMIIVSFVLINLLAMGEGKPGIGPDKESRNSAQIIIRDDDGDRERGNDLTALFHAQIYEYNYTDIETGERMSTIIQLVTNVNSNGLTFCDANGVEHDAAVNKKSEVVLSDRYDRPVPRSRRADDDIPLSAVLRRGDLVVVEGTYRLNEKMLATRIRFIGTIRGNNADNPRLPEYGYRYYGVIESVDARRGYITIKQDNRKISATFNRSVVILANGREQSVDYLRTGDRVVAYANDASNQRNIELYRIVVLGANERYPRDNEPYWADPDSRSSQDKSPSKPTAPMMEGTLLTYTRGYYNSQLDIMSADGRINSFVVAATIPLSDRYGAAITLDTLRRGDRLRIYYQPAKGIMEALRIELY